MVVVVIIAVLVTMAGLSMRGDRAGDALEEEAKRLTALLNLLREEAVMRDLDLGLTLAADGYLFVARQEPDPRAPVDRPEFMPLTDDPVFRPRPLPDGAVLRFESAPGRTASVPARPERYAPTIQAAAGDLLFPPGHITLRHPASARSYAIRIDPDGALLEDSHAR